MALLSFIGFRKHRKLNYVARPMIPLVVSQLAINSQKTTVKIKDEFNAIG